MADIVERLRELADGANAHTIGELWNGLEEGADEIERLRAENKDLRAARGRALEHIAEWLKWADTDPWANAHTVAACVAELEEVLRYRDEAVNNYE